MSYSHVFCLARHFSHLSPAHSAAQLVSPFWNILKHSIDSRQFWNFLEQFWNILELFKVVWNLIERAGRF